MKKEYMKIYRDGKPDDMSKLRIYLKKRFGVFLGILLLFTSLPGYSQTSEVTLRNDSLIDANNLIVDIYVRATSGSFYYSWGQYKVSFNSAISNGGTISVSIVPGFSDLTNSIQLPASFIVGSTSWRATAGTIPGGQAACSQISASGIGTRICRVRLTNTATFATNAADMLVVTTPPNATAVYYSDAGGFSNEGGVTMVNTNLTNPVLNAAITAFNVTGGGASPSLVGLNGSQSDGVNYTLYKDGSPSGSAIDGTGSTLSFGSQTEGSYTVLAHRKATYMSSFMNGTAIVSSALVSIPTATPGTVCAGTSVQLGAGASGGSGSYTYSWSSSPAGFSSSLANPTATPSVNTIYYVNVNDGIANVNSQVSVTVNAIPTITGTTPGSRCGTGTVILGATASAGTINWYADVTGGVSLGTGISFTTPSISATTTYYADATNNGCTTLTRTAVIASVNSIPTITGTTPASRCGTGTVVLGATASAGTINWYAASTGGASLGTGTTFTTPSISATTTYYADATNNGCTTATRTAVIATVNAIPTITGTTPDSRCGTGTVVLGATASAGTINWYAASTGGASLGTGTSFTTPSISTNTTYWVDATNGSCTTASRTSVIATVNALPPAPTQNVDCSLGFGQAVVTVLSPTGAGYEYRLDVGTYQTGTSFTAVANGSHTITVRNAAGCTTTGGSFDVSCGCVNGPTVTLSSASGSTCGTTPVTVAANTFGGSATQVTISDNGAGTVSPGSTTVSPFSFTYTPAAGDIGSTVTVTVTTNNPSGAPCAAATATYMLTVNAVPTITGTTPGSRCGTGVVTLGATASAGTINWYAASTGGASLGTGTSFATPSISTTTTYYVDATTNGCTTATRTAVIATVNAIPTITSTTPGSRCGTGTVILGATASAGTINWYAAATGGTSLGTGTSFTTPSISATTTYYADATNGSCTTATRTAVIASVNAVPVVDAGTNQTIPYGTSTTINATVTGTGLSYSWDPATSLVNATVVDPTTVNLTSTTLFTLTATSGSCSASDQVTITISGGALSATATATPSTICAGASIQLSAGASGGTGIYTYSWTSIPAGYTSSAANPTVTPAVNTTYYVAVNDGITTANSNVAVTVNAVPAQPTITAIGATTFCAGGSVTLTATAALSYLWSNGAITQSINVTTSGSYTVQVTNASGCQSVPSAATSVTVNPVPAQPTITAGGPTTLCTGGSVTLTSSTGVTYLWSNGVTTQSIDVTTAGSYTVQVASGAGCQSIASAAAVVTVNALPAQPTITAGGATTFCSGGSVTLTSSAGNTYLWSTGAITPSINVTVSGSYTVRVTNAAGCQSVSSAATIVTVNALPAQPTITAGGPRTFCEGGSVTLSSSAGNTYLWSSSETTQSIDVTASGSYTVRVTNAAGCQSTASAATTVTVNPLPMVNAGTDASIPFGTNTVLNATVTGTSPFTYSWTPSNLLLNATVVDPTTLNLSSTATFTLTATSTSTTCANTDAVTITVTGGALNSVPTATPSTVCAGSSVQLAAVASGGSGNFTYTWSSAPAGFTSSLANPTATPSVNTVYTVAVNDGFNTVNVQVSVTVNALPPQPVITADGSANFCAGGSVTLTSSAGTTWLWSTGATTQSINVNTSGSFTVRVTNASGCQSIASEAVTTVVNAPPSAPIVGVITPPTCSLATGSVLLMGLPFAGTWTLTRYPGTIASDGSGANFTVEGLNSGVYNYSVTNAAGCVSTLSANVNIPAQPATPGAPVVGTITQPTYTVPTGSVNLSGLPVSGTWTLTILPGGATINASGSSRTVSGLDPGTYTFTVTNTVGCSSLPTAQVTINARPGAPNLLINNPATICSNQTADLTLPAVTAGSDEGLTFTYWTDAGGTVAYLTPTAAPPGTYYIKGITTADFYSIKPVTVTADQLPVAYAGPDQVLDYLFGTTLNADLPEIGVGLWSLATGAGEIFNSAAPSTDVNGLALGDNVFEWAVTNGVCSPVIDMVTIEVNDLLIPTLITPNNDGRNDYFVLRGLESLGSTELVIFDRRGLKVYENNEYDNTWEGLDYNSNPLPDDTYFYVIRTASGKSLSGYIVVRR